MCLSCVYGLYRLKGGGGEERRRGEGRGEGRREGLLRGGDDLPEKICFSSVVGHMASSFSFGSDQSIDSPDRVPSSGIGSACQYHKEQYQHFAFSILFCPVQTVLQTVLVEPHSLFERLDQLSVQGSRECLCVQTEFFPFPFENPAHSPNLDFFYLSTTVSRSLKVSENKRHQMG